MEQIPSCCKTMLPYWDSPPAQRMDSYTKLVGLALTILSVLTGHFSQERFFYRQGLGEEFYQGIQRFFLASSWEGRCETELRRVAEG